MHLKKLEIQGFKSFAEFTSVEFDEGMTAVVGPNGSGKSNITDAIRWVLGEQSVRTLRGGKMEDVIFNGTQSRKAMNYAEVSLILDNEDGALPIDYREVQITRRLYRSGESEFLLNKTNCRLKDIISLFMDTGLGKDGYSIIGQGRVDDVLSNKSEDRRKILEEASGIVKYKVRRDEAQKKLVSTEQNLVRISDILTELEEQLLPLEEQAEKARRYHRLSEEWTRVDMGLSLHLIKKHMAFLSSVDENIAKLDEGIEELEDEILRIRTENQNSLLKQEELQKKEEDTRTLLGTILEKIHERQRETAVTSDRKEQILNRLASEKDLEGNVLSEKERFEAELSAQRKKLSTLDRQKILYSKQLEEGESELAQLFSTLGEKEKTVAEMRERTEALQELIFSCKEEFSALAAERGSMEAREKAVELEKTLAIGESDALRIRLEESEKVFFEFSNAESDVMSHLEERASALSVGRKKAEDISAEQVLLQRKLDQVKYQIHTLEELERSKEGFQEPVKRLLLAAESDENIALLIKGVVGELIQAPAEFETAIEIALGQSLHHVVTPTKEDASQLIRFLKEHQMGRATFLPLPVISARYIEAAQIKKVKEASGFVGIAGDLVTYPSELENIVWNLLGRIVIAQDMECALKIASLTGNSLRVVTLDGDMINPGGSMTGGSLKRRSSGVLGRTRQLEEIKRQGDETEENLHALTDSLKAQEDLVRELAGEHEKFDSRLREIALNRVRSEEIIAQIRVDETRMADRFSRINAQTEELRLTIQTSQTKEDEISALITSYERERETLRISIEGTREENRKVQEELDDLRSEIGDMRISVGSIDESIRGSKEIEDRIIRERDSFTENLAKRERDRESASLEIASLEERKERCQKEIFELQNTEAVLRKSLDEIKEEQEEMRSFQSAFSERLSDRSSILMNFQNDRAKLEARKENVTLTLDEIKNRMWEEHEKTWDDADEFSLDIEDEASVQKKILDLRNRMRSLGSINFGAIDEYRRIHDRFTFITDQKLDVEVAKENLEDMIESLTKEMREQFLSHFQKINENFRAVFADLFSGGTADILLEDEVDILSSDIQIRAQPPGKKLQNLSLLSGGERCLTAIALLFSILQLRPAPFCVLDEVEAALDDLNVSRFTDFVRNYTEKSQFILVTHRKGTMEACDKIYGVTMQERGISKILSMRLGDAG